MSDGERGRLMVKRHTLAKRLGMLERALTSAGPGERVNIQVGIDALRKAMTDLARRIRELGGK